MKFWDKVFFENNLFSYLIVFIVILVAFLIKRFLSKYIASLLYLPVKRSSTIDKNVFIDLVVSPLEIFLVILISILAIDRLTFPQEFIIKIYHVTTKQIVESTLIGILIISFTSLLLRFIDFIALIIEHKQHVLSQSDNQLIFFFKDFLKVLIVICAVLLVMKYCFNSHIGQLITSLSIVGAAIALAAKESLENLIASFIIFFDKPFLAGDFVKISNFSGVVERIGLRSTRLRTLDETLVVVPNKQMVDAILDNFSKRREVKNDIKIELAPQTSSEKLHSAVEEIKSILEKRKLTISSYTVFLVEISKSSAVILAEYFTPYQMPISDVNSLKQELMIAIKVMQEKNGLRSFVENPWGA